MEAKNKRIILCILKISQLVLSFLLLQLLLYKFHKSFTNINFIINPLAGNGRLQIGFFLGIILCQITIKCLVYNLLIEKFKHHNGQVKHIEKDYLIVNNVKDGLVRDFKLFSKKNKQDKQFEVEGPYIPSYDNYINDSFENKSFFTNEIKLFSVTGKIRSFLALSCSSTILYMMPLIIDNLFDLGFICSMNINRIYMILSFVTSMVSMATIIFGMCTNLIFYKRHDAFNANLECRNTSVICTFIATCNVIDCMRFKMLGKNLDFPWGIEGGDQLDGNDDEANKNKYIFYTDDAEKYISQISFIKFIKAFMIEVSEVLPVNLSEIKNERDGKFNVLGIEFVVPGCLRR